MSCLVCGRTNVDRCHIKTKGSGGSDQDQNIMLLCREHHVEQHKIGVITFIEKHPQVMAYIETMGWEIIGINSFKRLVRK